MLLTLENELLRVRVSPKIGASVTEFSYTRDGSNVHLMRPAPESFERSSLANFVMAPYSNRIKEGLFSYRGKEFQLLKPEKHAIHGDVRDRVWNVLEESPEQLLFSFDSRQQHYFNFPFRMSAQVLYRLSADALLSELTIVNQDSEPMPVGGGFHPYFMKSLGEEDELVELQFNAGGVFLYDGELPFSDEPPQPIQEKFDFSKRKPLIEGLDHGYSGWDGQAEMYWPVSKVRLQMEAGITSRHLILFTPSGKPFFALEPVSNSTDAFNQLAAGMSGTGVVELQPEETFTVSYRLQISFD